VQHTCSRHAAWDFYRRALCCSLGITAHLASCLQALCRHGEEYRGQGYLAHKKPLHIHFSLFLNFADFRCP